MGDFSLGSNVKIRDNLIREIIARSSFGRFGFSKARYKGTNLFFPSKKGNCMKNDFYGFLRESFIAGYNVEGEGGGL